MIDIPKFVELPSVYTAVRDIINFNDAGTTFSAGELKGALMQVYGAGIDMPTTSYSEVVQLFVAVGYLKEEAQRYVYTIEVKVPEDLTLVQLRAKGKPILLEKSGTLKAVHTPQYCSDELFNLEYQVIKIICENNLNYIQGCVFKYIMQYKKDIMFIHKIKHMCKFGIAYQLKGLTYRESIDLALFDFVAQNGVDDFQASMLRKISLSKYTEVIKMCDSYISIYNVKDDELN